MDNKGTREIRTDRLILRRFTVSDAKDMFCNWANDPKVTKYLRWVPHENVEASRKLLSEWVGSYDDAAYYSWAIALKENNIAIGSLGLMDVSEIDEAGEIGYCMGRNWWGKGIMTEALQAVIRYAFEQCGFNRLQACHSVNNPASGRVMQKANMIFEGIARQKYKANEGFQDCKVYAILKEDYLKQT